MKRIKEYGKPPSQFKADIGIIKYQELSARFADQGDWSQAVYLYFDTSSNPAEAKLYKNRLRLRARIKYGNYSLELKVRTLDNHEEICEPISLEEFNLVLQGQLPAGAIQTRLRELNMLWPLLWISTTNSVRKKIHFYGGVLVLDQTRCCLNLQTHYQLEFRSKQANSPQAIELIKKQLQVVAHGHRRKREEIWPGPVV